MGVGSFAVALVITAALHLGMSQGSQVTLTVEPPGPSVFAGETVSLRCFVMGRRPGNWTFRWYRHDPPTLCPQTRLHWAAGDRYSIEEAGPSDQGPYWCRAEQGAPPTLSLPSNAVLLTVSDPPSAVLTLQPNSRQHFRLEQLTLWCPAQGGSSTGWTLKRMSRSGLQSGCLPAGGTVTKERPRACQISSLFSGNSGLYWCESDMGNSRTSAVNITVVYGPLAIQSPAQPVAGGASVTLRCLYWQPSANASATAFYRDGVEVQHSDSVEMVIHNVTGAHQGFYTCADANGTESPPSLLTVRGTPKAQSQSPTELQLLSAWPTEAPSPVGSWLTVVMPCCILGVLLILAVALLAQHHRSPLRCSRCSGCPTSTSQTEEPKGEGPQTKPDATEIQWDVPWTEMEATLLGGTQDEEQGI